MAFACKGRGFCPSCGGKRMTQFAAHLVDHVIPVVPTRQYVLSLPWQLRARLAYDHTAQKAVLGIFLPRPLGLLRPARRKSAVSLTLAPEPPHKNLAARSKWRRRAVAYGRPKVAEPTAPARPSTPASAVSSPPPRHHNRAWAAMMRRAFELDVLSCPKCAGRLKLIACVTQPAAIRAILEHLALPADAPEPQPARAPPWAHAADGAGDDDSYESCDEYDSHDAIDDDPNRAA